MTIFRKFSRMALALTFSVVAVSGCAVIRGQESASEYASDTSVTASIKSRMIEDKSVSAAAISVETLNGVVQLSGFARSAEERRRAGEIAASTRGASSVRNDIVIRP
jgi:hyperosmotically inducible periplasmic protein